MRVNDIVLGLGSIIIGGIIYFLTIGFPALKEGGWIGPALFPRILALLFALFGGILTVQGLLQRAPAPSDTSGGTLGSRRSVINALFLFGAIIFYILASEYLGFLITGFLILIVMMFQLKVRIKVSLPASLILVVGIYYLFAKILRVPLPYGILGW